MGKPLVIAHRGDSSAALENSLAAIRSALALPADMIEIDIRKSLDDVLYVMHDRTTGRTAMHDVDIERAASSEIDAVRLKNDEPVPRLDLLLRLVRGRIGINIEIKSRGAGTVLQQYLSKLNYAGELLVSSFEEHEVLPFLVEKSVRASVIFDSFSLRDVPSYFEKGFRTLSLRKSSVDAKLVRACKDRAIQLYVWTVDDEQDMKRLIALGVDGIYSNRPGLLKRVVRESASQG